MKGTYVLLLRPRGGCFSALLKMWELHWRDRAGQDVFCNLEVLETIRFASLTVPSGKCLSGLPWSTSKLHAWALLLDHL